MPGGDLFTLAAKYQAELAAGEALAADRLVRSHAVILRRLRADEEALLARIEQQRRAGGAIPKGWLYQERRYTDLIARAEREMSSYAVYAHGVVVEEAERVAGLAAGHARSLVETAMASAAPDLSVSLLGVNPANVVQVLGFTSPGSPLAALMASLGPETAAAMQGALLNGVAQGWHVRKIAGEMRRAENLSLNRALLIARTETLRAYRETSRQSYAANSDVVDGWTWHAALDSRCCAACVIMAGTFHSHDETLDGHPRCRCVMVPSVKSFRALGLDVDDGARPEPVQGKDWLESQPASVQQGILGAKYDPWRRREIDLDDLVGRRHDPRWGSMRYERSLAEIRQAKRRGR